MEYPIPVVRIILQDKEGKILFLKRGNTKYESGKWCLPGGKIESGETAEEACKKETKEETNLDISNLKFLFYKEGASKIDKEITHWLNLYFKADFSGDIKLNKESSDYVWLNPKDIDKFDLAFNQKEIIKKFIHQ